MRKYIKGIFKGFKFRGWSILGLINSYLGWKYNKLICLTIELETGKVIKASLVDADEYDNSD